MPTWPLARIQLLLERTLEHMGYTIYGIEQVGSGGRTLRIAIDKPQGFVSIADCQKVSEVAGPLLDQADLIPDRYTLEVSSPGAERKLRNPAEFDRFLGRRVHVRARAGDAELVLEGVLEAVDEEGIQVRGHREEIARVGWTDVVSARLVASL